MEWRIFRIKIRNGILNLVNANNSRQRAGVRATEFTLIILPLLGERGRGEGSKALPAHRYKMFLFPYIPAQSAGEGDAVTPAVMYHCLTVGQEAVFEPFLYTNTVLYIRFYGHFG